MSATQNNGQNGMRARIRAKLRKKKYIILQRYLRGFYLSFVLILFVTLLGVVGFMLIEDYSLVEAFYMTVITLSTVGYTEVKPLTDTGRIFTSFLIIANLGTFAYAISNLTTYIIDGNLKRMIQEYSLQSNIDKLKGHVILCGFGRYGAEVVKHFKLHKVPFVIIEASAAVADKIQEKGDLLYLHGDATHDEVLEMAGIRQAKSLITTLPDDAENVYVSLTARQMNPSLRIISRALSQKSEAKLKLAGANEVITLEEMGGFFMATLIGKPDLVTFFRILSYETSASVSLEEIGFEHLPDDNSPLTIRQLNIRENSGASVIGLKTLSGDYIVNPSPETVLKRGMQLFVLGNHDQILKFQELWTKVKQQ
ncbi:potassium channel protein [Sphingobacteriales bacterium UPWRP_1]|nr:hypothetical protein BVG80_18230 [Sphingobacteriales bacterium TSM_CSM]PSJ73582.1 potassium channel protein [Sphingobacteriales bacterium UPWRP_1]